MTPDLIVLLALGIFFLLLALETPVAFALGISGTVGIVLLRNFNVASSVLGSVPFESTAKYALIVIPMYILLGMFVLEAGIAEHLYRAANKALARLPGGLGMATVATCAGFAAVSGSSVATAAAMGRISVSEMRKHGYSAGFASGIVAIAATLGVLIPPSVILVIYAILTGESVAQLLAAGVIPGLLSAVSYMVMIQILVRRKGAVQSSVATRAPAGTGRDTAALRSVFYVLVIFVIVMGGVYSGVMTATESSAIGAIFALAIMLGERSRAGRSALMTSLRRSTTEGASLTSMSLAIVIGAGIFTFFLVSARIPAKITNSLVGLEVSPIVVIVLILIACIPLGMFLDSLSILVIVVPLTYPTVVSLGFEGVWFGILMVKMIEIGLVTPPVGLNVFVISGTTGIKLETVFKGVVPFLLAELGVIIALMAVPDIALWLPNQVAP